MNENEQRFLKTMIETLRYDGDDYLNSNNLLTILRYSMIKYRPTGLWGKGRGKSQENIVLRVPVPMIKEARSLKDEFEKLASEVYLENDYDEFGHLEIKPKPVELDIDESKEHNVVFDEIKDEIVQGIRNAKYTIWVAVAWITDREIFTELLLRKQAGVNIRIITSEEDSNRYLINELESNFEVVKVPLKSGSYFTNRLHDKFCVIDLEFVMHGSYNWSKNATHNEETLATALDKDFVRKFADQFMKLYNEYK